MFMSMMNSIFSEYINDFVVVYLDDVVIMSSTPEQHLLHLKLVLTKSRIHKLYAKMANCEFNKPEVKFHVVGREGIKVDPAKIAVIQEWPVPTSTTEWRQFWGLANNFRKFIQGYSSLAAPLTALISNDKVRLSLTPSQMEAFQQIKHALTHAPVLTPPDF